MFSHISKVFDVCAFCFILCGQRFSHCDDGHVHTTTGLAQARPTMSCIHLVYKQVKKLIKGICGRPNYYYFPALATQLGSKVSMVNTCTQLQLPACQGAQQCDLLQKHYVYNSGTPL